ncbi:MAG: Protein translocase subunit SecA [Microgenomates bacterium OLB23]|nr:MAG: Protein translocase subunit SecA [Microgenomates bacterium OLB23]
MLGFVKKIFDFNEREITRIRGVVATVNTLEDDARKLNDADFRTETAKLKKQIAEGKNLDEVLPWAYALVREASRRMLGLRQFDEQLIAGVALHEGKIAEQKTGEGKTLSAVAPLYLNALTGKGAHLVTVNDYLARRDAGWMGPVYNLLGLQVASIISDKTYIYYPEYQDANISDWRLLHLKPVSRKEGYLADVTYGINSEFGFDYLRDNMSKSIEQVVQRNFHFAIIDEVDSVLIDEARTPHIISSAYEQDVSRYYEYARIVNQLSDKDYVIDEKLRTSHLTEEGIAKLEKLLGVDNVYEKDYETLYHVEAALKAHTLFKKDKDYIVKDGQVIIVDEFTGRLLEGRRFSEGLHQAIEAKENVEIKQESRTLATVSLQNYFRMYEKLAGMTGTAQTEAEEFSKIYKLDTLVIPTHQQVKRVDLPDYIYKTEKGKFKAVVEEIARLHKEGIPVLVGTVSIDKNETLSQLLKKKNIPHQLLNAKNHEKEAQIIAGAGIKGAVTVATNMAGRGVDIVLGGEPPSRFKIDPDKTKKQIEDEYNKLQSAWQKRHDEVVELGGLHVISTDRHESRRIDNQLRGRSGRQGDPGQTRFFVSLEDDLMRIFGGEQVSKVMTFFNLPEDQPLEHSMVSRALEQAQAKVEGFNFDMRKNLVEYDDVLNKQREILYGMRRHILESSPEHPEQLDEELGIAIDSQVNSLINTFILLSEEPDIEGLVKELDNLLPATSQQLSNKLSSIIGEEPMREAIMHEFVSLLKKREKEVGKDLWVEVKRYLFLDTIDRFWTDHLTAIDDLRQGINLRGYAQLNPLTEYKNEAFSMFEKLLTDVHYDVVRRLFQVQVNNEETSKDIKQAQQQAPKLHLHAASAQSALGNKPATETSQPTKAVAKSVKKLGRNDPCWCGSGKKYKKCHMNEDAAR